MIKRLHQWLISLQERRLYRHLVAVERGARQVA